MAKREHTVPVLQGGGALGAYQAGVCKGIAETGFNRFSAVTAVRAFSFRVNRLLPLRLMAPARRLVSTTPRRSKRRCKNVDLDLLNRRACGFLPSRPAMSIEGVGIVPSVFTLSLHQCLNAMHRLYPSLCIVVAIVLMKEQTWTFFIRGGF